MKLMNFENWSIGQQSKNVDNKKCAPKFLFFIGTKKIRMIVDVEN